MYCITPINSQLSVIVTIQLLSLWKTRPVPLTDDPEGESVSSQAIGEQLIHSKYHSIANGTGMKLERHSVSVWRLIGAIRHNEAWEGPAWERPTDISRVPKRVKIHVTGAALPANGKR